MRQDIYNAPNPNFTGEFDLMRNGTDSSYQAPQAQFRHRLAHGLQTLLCYTWRIRSTTLLRRLLFACTSRKFGLVSRARLVRLRHPAHVLLAQFL